MAANTSERGVPWLPAAALGIAAFAVEYVVVYLWQAARVQRQHQLFDALVKLLGGQPPPTWLRVGWLFYGAHFVSVDRPALGSGRASVDLVSQWNAPLLVYLVPPVVLVAAGYLLARYVGLTDPVDGALAGTVVSLGYALPAWFCVFAFRVTAGGRWAGPAVVPGLVLAGVVYPVVFGGVGGALAGSTNP